MTVLFILYILLVDEMGERIDELEKSIGDLMAQAGLFMFFLFFLSTARLPCLLFLSSF